MQPHTFRRHTVGAERFARGCLNVGGVAQDLDRLVAETLAAAKIDFRDLSAIAATGGPGLIGGVMVGVMTAKAIAAVHRLPFLAVNHLEGHALSPRLSNDVAFPYLLLLVSGGHCQFLVAEGVGRTQHGVDEAGADAPTPVVLPHGERREGQRRVAAVDRGSAEQHVADDLAVDLGHQRQAVDVGVGRPQLLDQAHLTGWSLLVGGGEHLPVQRGNGVVVGGDPAVLNYYRHQVIGGRTAFVLPADSAEMLVQVFAMKFVSEIALHIEPAVRPDRL